MTPRLVFLGRIVKPHGLRGELRFLPYNPDSDTLEPGAPVWLQQAGQVREARIVTLRPHGQLRLLTLDGVDSAEAAESLRGAEIGVAADSLPVLEPGQVYHHDLPGLRVETIDGTPVGTVRQVLPMPGPDLCVVDGRDGKEHLIPLVEAIVRSIDLAAGVLRIDPPAGLLEL